MRTTKINRAALSLLALAGVTLALPLGSQAASTNAGQPGPPAVTTGGVSRVTGASAVLEGNVDPRTYATTYYFQYGATTAYGSQTTPADLPAGTTKVKVSQSVSGLLTGYHYRLVASNQAGTTDGHDHTFNPKAKKKKSAFQLPKTYKPIPMGSEFILSGTLTGTGNGNRAIVLQASAYPYSATYLNVGSPIVTDAAGYFSFRVPDLTISTKFRVSTVSGTLVHSLIVPQQVSVRVALKVRSSARKGLVRLYGTVTPAEVGAHVFFQLEKPPKSEATPKAEKPGRLEKPGKGKSERGEEKGPTFVTKFSTVVKGATKSISRFSAIVNVRDAGRYRAFVQLRPGPLASGHSLDVTLQAPTDSKKKKQRKR